jgi:hypothetical protein
MTPPALGPQHGRDAPFARRMRLHQSWYRAHVLSLECGTGPTASSERAFGNMLTRTDGDAGANFLTPEIFRVAQRRLAENRGAVEPYRLKHNMLSSQPMCFNLFGPLVDDLSLATRLVRAHWGKNIAHVTRVVVEWAPTPKREHLDDKTAFDAFIEVEFQDGRMGFIGIETKLTEPFSKQRSDKPSYRRWMTPDGPWRDDVSDRVAEVAHNQLWRNHLLAEAVLRHPASPYQEGHLAVVYHPLDERCTSTIASYQTLLREPKAVEDLPLDRLVAAWQEELGEGSWLDAFRARYIDLAPSAPFSS